MRSFLTILFFILLFFLPGCITKPDNFFQSRNQEKIIAIQPLETYDTTYLNFISKEISNFYKRKVIVLKPIYIPSSFSLAKNTELYSADSILNRLQTLIKGEIIEAIGLTHKEIGILKKTNKTTDDPLFDYYVESVFGLGDFPGNCCIVSDFSFKSFDTLFRKSCLRKVVIHEVGHNLNLDHCKLDKCIMSEKNGSFAGLSKSGNDYCEACKNKIKYRNL